MIRRAALVSSLAFLLATSALAVPAITMGSASGQPGQTVNVAVSFTNDASITAVQFDVNFDSTKITTVGTPTEGTALASTDHEVDSNLVSAGRFRVLVYSNSLAVIPSGQLVVIPFTLSGSVATGTNVALTLSDVEMVEANATVVSGTSAHGQISVTTNTCVALGDVHPDGVGNGSVVLQDFVLARRKALGTVAQNAHDAACGNVFPIGSSCTPVSGKIRLCPNPNTTGNPINVGDVVVIRRIVAQTHEINCVACGSRTTGITRVAGDVAPRGLGDGRLDVADVVLALRMSVGLEPMTSEGILADVAPSRRVLDRTLADGNGVVDIGDVVLLLRAAVGLENVAWPERQIDVRLPVATPRIAFSVRVAGWPELSEVLSVSSPECAGEDVGLDVAGDRWAVTCASDPDVTTTAGIIATVTHVGPRVTEGMLSVESSLVGPGFEEVSGRLVLELR